MQIISHKTLTHLVITIRKGKISLQQPIIYIINNRSLIKSTMAALNFSCLPVITLRLPGAEIGPDIKDK